MGFWQERFARQGSWSASWSITITSQGVYLPFIFISIVWAVSIHTVTAFLYNGTTMIDLNTRLSGAAGWRLIGALAIHILFIHQQGLADPEERE